MQDYFRLEATAYGAVIMVNQYTPQEQQEILYLQQCEANAPNPKLKGRYYTKLCNYIDSIDKKKGKRK